MFSGRWKLWGENNDSEGNGIDEGDNIMEVGEKDSGCERALIRKSWDYCHRCSLLGLF